MSNDIQSKNGLITVPFDKVTKSWVAGYIKHPGHTPDELRELLKQDADE